MTLTKTREGGRRMIAFARTARSGERGTEAAPANSKRYRTPERPKLVREAERPERWSVDPGPHCLDCAGRPRGDEFLSLDWPRARTRFRGFNTLLGSFCPGQATQRQFLLPHHLLAKRRLVLASVHATGGPGVGLMLFGRPRPLRAERHRAEDEEDTYQCSTG